MEPIQHLSSRGLRRLRNSVVAVLSLLLYAAPVAGANDHPFLTPSRGGLVGEAWARIYSLPVAENPFTSDRNQCLRLGRDVIEAVSEHPCTITRGTGVMLYLGSAWSNAEAPYPADEAAQRAAAFAADQTVSKIQVTVDGATSIDIHTPRFELFSPQRTARLPADNILGLPAQTVTLTAHGWSALVRHLAPGRHTIVVDAVWNGVSITARHVVNVLRCGRFVVRATWPCRPEPRATDGN